MSILRAEQHARFVRLTVRPSLRSPDLIVSTRKYGLFRASRMYSYILARELLCPQVSQIS